MSTLKRTTLALALAAALPAMAAEPAVDVKKELQALKDRIAELEKAKAAAPAPGGAGMSAEQLADFNRIAVKTEALEDGRDAAGLGGLVLSGWTDVNYVYNLNKERGTFQYLVPIAKEAYNYDNSYMGMVALDIQKETDSGTNFRLTLVPARSNGDVMGENGIVHEAYVSVPISGQDTRLLAGQVTDWMGYEYLPPTQNKLITHNLLFDFTTPATYLGAGLELSRGNWILKALLANVDTSVRNVGEDVPVLVYRGDYEGGEFWGFGFAGLHGKMVNFAGEEEDTWADTFELDGWYARGDLSLFGHLVYGRQKKAAIATDALGTPLDASWAGVSALAAYKLTPRLEGILRGDFIYNQKNGGGLLEFPFPDPVNGIGPDQSGDPAADPTKGANRYAISAGLNYALNENSTLKAEYRYDGATQKVFQKNSDGSFVKSNSLFSTGVVVFF
ncbi:MAG: DUF3138 family protein [Anaeromyxobacteraceae bacterium]|nr:DUF3138 family protein [Anaeromyxobacteraceae bacterium]